MELQPISFDEACSFVRKNHCGQIPAQGCKFNIAVNDGEKIIGVIFVGRPSSLYKDDGWTLEVTMCCTDGTKGADTILYNAALQVTRSMGYKQLITYTLVTETPRVPGEDEKGEPQITARVSPEERSSLNSILKFPDHQKERLSDIDNLRMWLKRAKAIFEKLGHHDWVEDITDALDRLNRDDFGFVESLWIKFARDVDDLILIAPSLHDPPLTETQADELNGELAEVANQTFAAIDRVRDATSSLISSLV